MIILSLSILNDEKRVSNIFLRPLIVDKVLKGLNTLSDLKEDNLTEPLYIAVQPLIYYPVPS